MEKKRHILFFAAMIIIIGVIAVSTAAKHTAIDEAKLYQWRMDTAITRRSR